ncbi:MAG: hypothetical protein WBZ25_06190 [Pseudolabrys sp.]
MLRVVVVLAGLASTFPVMAGEMTAREARQFVVEKLFSYTCFDGTRGMARVHADRSVDGSIQVRGGLPRYGRMPLGTLRVGGDRVCAYLRGSMMQPCFYLERTNDNSFRGSIAGLSFAYCDFTRYQGAAQTGRGEQPLSLTADR